MVLNLVNLYSLIFALIDKIGDMTTELQTFKNITKMLNESMSMSTTAAPRDYTDVTECGCILNKVSLLSRNLISENDYSDLTSQLSDLVSNITSLVVTNITTTFNESISDIQSLNTSLTYFVNRIIQEKIIGTLNITIDNTTNFDSQELNLTDIEFNLTDYLTSLLFSLPDDDNSTMTYEKSTSISDNITTTTWEEFSSTIFPLLNSSDSTDLDRFDYDFSSSTSFDFTSTALQEESTTESPYCKEICDQTYMPPENVEQGMNYTTRARFRNLCWETMFGQELISITVMDLIMTIVPALGMDFFRGIFVRVMNRCWCWDLEKKFPKYGDFKVAENILSLVNNQGMVWMGMFFCPGLVVFNVFKLYITMYFKAWAVMTCNVPPEVIFRASRSNNFYYYLLLMMLFLCVLPVGYTVVWIKPSWHCGPFSKYKRIFHIFTNTIQDNVPKVLQRALDYIASPGIVIPLLVLLILIIYYLISLTNSLREANEELKIQLRRERTEERRKMFQLADRRRRRGGSGESNELSNAPFNKWKKLIGNLPSGKSLDETPKQEAEDVKNKDERTEARGKDFFSKFIKRALRKSSTSDDDQNAEDGTDTEQHDSLPYDTLTTKATTREIKPSFSWGKTDFQNVARKAIQLKKTKSEIQPTKSFEITTETKHVQINDEVNKVNSDINRNIHSTRETFSPRTESTPKDVTIHQNSDYKKTKYIKDDSRRKEKSKHISRNRTGIKNTFPIKEEIIRDEPSTSKVVRENSGIIKIHTIKEILNNTPIPTNIRQDSESSIWSDGIPVITISKTVSSENILDVCDEPWAEEEPSTLNKNEDTQKFKPKIRCVLKKQATIDEDTIRYFNDDIERNKSMVNIIKAVAEEDDDFSEKLSPDTQNEDSKGDEALTDKSSSEDTEQKDSSVETILRSPQLIDED